LFNGGAARERLPPCVGPDQTLCMGPE